MNGSRETGHEKALKLASLTIDVARDAEYVVDEIEIVGFKQFREPERVPVRVIGCDVHVAGQTVVFDLGRVKRHRAVYDLVNQLCVLF